MNMYFMSFSVLMWHLSYSGYLGSELMMRIFLGILNLASRANFVFAVIINEIGVHVIFCFDDFVHLDVTLTLELRIEAVVHFMWCLNQWLQFEDVLDLDVTLNLELRIEVIVHFMWRLNQWLQFEDVVHLDVTLNLGLRIEAVVHFMWCLNHWLQFEDVVYLDVTLNLELQIEAVVQSFCIIWWGNSSCSFLAIYLLNL